MFFLRFIESDGGTAPRRGYKFRNFPLNTAEYAKNPEEIRTHILYYFTRKDFQEYLNKTNIPRNFLRSVRIRPLDKIQFIPNYNNAKSPPVVYKTENLNNN